MITKFEDFVLNEMMNKKDQAAYKIWKEEHDKEIEEIEAKLNHHKDYDPSEVAAMEKRLKSLKNELENPNGPRKDH